MLSLSVLWILSTFGFAIAWHMVKVYWTAKTAKPSFQHDIWIVFGQKLNANLPTPEFKKRLDAAIEWQAHKQPKLIILQGGMTHKNTVSEAQAGQTYFYNSPKLINQCNSLTQLILEDKSRNTLENLRNTREYLQREKTSLKVTLISNRYHLLRCSIIAKNMGFSTELLPAESEWTLNLMQAYKILLEAFFLNWYHTGLFVSKILKNQKMLNKVL